MSEHESNIIVIGGGISGLTTATEAAEAGYTVTILEREPFLGGRVSRMNKYFPKLCPPTCGLEINYRRVKLNDRISVYTMSEVEKISGQAGSYEVDVKLKPRYINDKCTGCNACTEACPVEIPNDFNAGLDKKKAAFIPTSQAFPYQYVIDKSACKSDCGAKCKEACKYDAVDLEMQPETLKLKAASIVLATGWKPYDAKKIDNLGFGTSPSIITNAMMERIASGNGPTGGKITRPGDGKEAKKVAFVQCAGSRDENHLAYCSAVCCMASLKQITYVTDQYPDAEVYMFYIDIRTPGTSYEKFYNTIKDNENVKLIKGKVASVTAESNGDVTVEAEDILAGEKIKVTVDMVVLATGMQPEVADLKLPSDIKINENGFAVIGKDQKGIYAVGCAKDPMDVAKSVQGATGAALKAIQTVGRLS
ncbi:dihydrolipoamide dehydrogenase [bacterium BMS3Bbin09]|nr:dihydrolipoamide dehydrogenase [bacterium BMS3Bbin09]HDH34960.1 CoB--CoM heterodisulfide reductase iron-sulfur subunit A family protein [Nitrospirota bacterium]HDN94873.1 CoB--CoM heterodisulfide reductase iron-sulfur subunit A family protein [Nitrospirota bacterium]